MEERAPALSNEGRMHQEMYELKGLRPDTEYDVMIVAENKYGSYRESEETSVWTFRTQAEGVEVPTPEPETYWPEPEPESEGDSKPEQVQTEDKSGAERTRCVGVAMAIVMLLATMVV
ncbi:PREDICTED: uncharacterized protein LOC106813773 [Priapulus caudatus]|uniref:Uncharacterized protein LOC106813773 n=1 Tax=Priapulus caudatus TaxID=37621 RepID=A0ABM1EMQ9_PRICU|nr:PREDICTED: uncharacterized protein LOC106813773 [Priapulus caudatus]